MKKPPQAGGGRDVESTATETRSACPFAPDCTRRWVVDSKRETAECSHCYQTLTRAVMARILEGRL